MSDVTRVLGRYRQEMLTELTEHILPFWLEKVIDLDAGVFHGAVSGDDVPEPKADKGLILTSRILWTFSRAYGRVKEERYLRAADLVYRFLLEHFMDQEHGGVYWLVDHAGKPIDTTKKFYAQAFALYAFSEYARATGDPQPLREARALFDLIERYGRDPALGGYLDALGRDWKPVADTRLSLKDLNTPKTMNTNLHILEAYSELARWEKDGPVAEALASLTDTFLRRIVLPNRHFGLFFEMDWREVLGNVSFGHDIEGSWLLSEAAERARREDLLLRTNTVAVEMARVFLREGLDAQGGVLNERHADGSLKPGKDWWPQAEAMVGLFNAYQLSGEDAFLKGSLGAWEFVKRYFKRPTGEWYGFVDEDGVPDKTHVAADMWKCPYHTARACLEIVERIDHLTSRGQA